MSDNKTEAETEKLPQLGGVDWVIWTTNRIVKNLHECDCIKFPTDGAESRKQHLEAIRALISGCIAGDLDHLQDYQSIRAHQPTDSNAVKEKPTP